MGAQSKKVEIISIIKKCKSPVLLLAFNRPQLTERVFEVVKLVKPARLYIAQDGPRNSHPSDQIKIQQVREKMDVSWPCKVFTKFQKSNLGCKQAVYQGISWFFSQEEEGIILEDDCLPHVDFFLFCDRLLKKYRENKKVAIINGTNFSGYKPTDRSSYYFTKYPHIWGWAAFRHAWAGYDPDIRTWPSIKKSTKWKKTFGSTSERKYWERIMDETFQGRVDTWDYQLALSLWMSEKICITPSCNLVENIGFGLDATHTLNQPFTPRICKNHRLTTILHPQEVKYDQKNEVREFQLIFPQPSKRNSTNSFLEKLKNRFLKKLKFRRSGFFGDYHSWGKASQDSEGYDQPLILAKAEAAMREVLAGRAVFERDSVLLPKPEYPWPLISCLLHVAQASKGRISLLDFGGALGSRYYQCRPFLDGIWDLAWVVVEQDHYVKSGSREFARPPVSFSDSPGEACAAHRSNLLLLSGVLSYLPNPWSKLKELLCLEIPNVVIDRVPFLETHRDRLTVQRVPPEICPGSYPAWFFDRNRLMQIFASHGYEVIADWPCSDDWNPEGEKAKFMGLFLKKVR